MTIKDYQLIGLVCSMNFVIIVILIIWELVAPQYLLTKELTKEVYLMANDAEVRPYVRVCYSQYGTHFSWTIYITEGALLAFGAFLAWETRHVTIEALNDSHQIGMCLYNVVVLSAVGLTFGLLLEESVVMIYGITSGCVIIGTTLTQCIVFVPKVLAVYGHGARIEPATTLGSRSLPSHLSMKTHTPSAPPSFTGSTHG